jgi:hypothetical protein
MIVGNSRSLSPLEIFQMYVLLHTLASIQMSEALSMCIYAYNYDYTCSKAEWKSQRISVL